MHDFGAVQSPWPWCIPDHRAAALFAALAQLGAQGGPSSLTQASCHTRLAGSPMACPMSCTGSHAGQGVSPELSNTWALARPVAKGGPGCLAKVLAQRPGGACHPALRNELCWVLHARPLVSWGPTGITVAAQELRYHIQDTRKVHRRAPRPGRPWHSASREWQPRSGSRSRA